MSAVTYDLVLEYLSARRSGTWAQYKVAAMAAADTENGEETPTWAASVVAANLASLGHVEFAFETDLTWTCTPAVIAQTAIGSGIGVLVGRRDSHMVSCVVRAAADLNIRLDQRAQDYAPAALLLCGPGSEALAVLSDRCGVPFVPDAPMRLSRCLPSLASMYTECPEAPFPQGFPTALYDPASLRWVGVRAPSGDGLYRIDSYRPEFRVVLRDKVVKVTQNLGIQIALTRAGKIAVVYRPGTREIAVAAQARLPELYMRALTLCGGQLPAFDGSLKELTFRSIPPDVADDVLEGVRSLEGYVNG